MDPARGAVRTAASVIVLTTLVSGPVVPGIDLVHPRDDGSGIDFGADDEIDVSVLSVPADDVRIERGRYGSGTYYLRVPDAAVRTERVRGSPRLVYKLRIDELGYVRATAHFVDREREGERLALSIEEDTLSPDRIESDAYAGELLIVARDDDGAETVAHRNVTVEVRE